MIYVYFAAAIILTAWYFYRLGSNQTDYDVEALQEGMTILASLVDEMQTKLNEYGIEFENEMLEEADNEARDS